MSKKKLIPKWDPSKLPFLEEKLEFRKRNIHGLDRSGVVLCMYGGEEARLTLFYASVFRRVIAVDKDFSLSPQFPSNVIRVEMTDKRFLRCMDRFLPERLEVVDVDPYGSPMLFIKNFFARYRGTVRMLILTDGAMTVTKLRRKMNFYKHYFLKPNKPIKSTWHYKHFALIVFSALKQIVQEAGYIITDLDYEYNRYKTALYMAIKLEKENKN